MIGAKRNALGMEKAPMRSSQVVRREPPWPIALPKSIANYEKDMEHDQ